ncbi:hypothetical protein, partial [Flavobacterium crassostreae]|uniref:hypothetical protein n=1 Tax=Flavobacterium crassostreae TaxID=1763534 RepID=UPI001C400072
SGYDWTAVMLGGLSVPVFRERHIVKVGVLFVNLEQVSAKSLDPSPFFLKNPYPNRIRVFCFISKTHWIQFCCS